jgi:DegV family protein with EDD domain
MRVAVVTDSTCDLGTSAARRLRLGVVPLCLTRVGGGRVSPDDPEAVYAHQRAGGLVTTAPPDTATFAEHYARALRSYDAVLSVHLSRGLSQTVARAREAAAPFGDRVRVVDSGVASVALAEAALRARAALDAGGSLDTAEAAVVQTSAQGLTLFTVPSLDHLRLGGRLGRLAHLVGTVLDVRPVLGFGDGRLRPLRRVRTDQALAEMLLTLEDRYGAEPLHLTVAHAGADPARLLELRAAALRSRLRVVGGRAQLIGGVIGAHVGPGMYALGACPADL